MANLLKTGSDWLEQMRTAHCSSPVTYKRDAQALEINVTLGRTDYEVATEGGLNVGAHAWDFLILADDLGFEPESGDIIEADGQRYEVMALGDDTKGWRWSDPYRTTVRIHTKEIGAA
jgi:hypothetical protein